MRLPSSWRGAYGLLRARYRPCRLSRKAQDEARAKAKTQGKQTGSRELVGGYALPSPWLGRGETDHLILRYVSGRYKGGASVSGDMEH